VTKRENANTVSCRCVPVTTRIDSKTGHTVIVCKKMPETRRPPPPESCRSGPETGHPLCLTRSPVAERVQHQFHPARYAQLVEDL